MNLAPYEWWLGTAILLAGALLLLRERDLLPLRRTTRKDRAAGAPRHERRRMPHNLAMMAAMEGFQRLFQADPLPLRLLRNVGLDLVDGQAEAKALFVRQALGVSGDLPELARV